jgi:hypothetical protein
MKMTTIKLTIVALSALLITSCATTQDFYNTIGPPAQVQSEIRILGALALPRITSDNVKAQIHKFAEDMIQVADLNPAQLVALIPHTGNAAADALIAAAVSYVQSVVNKVGSRNPTALAYARAVGNGLLQAGY